MARARLSTTHRGRSVLQVALQPRIGADRVARQGQFVADPLSGGRPTIDGVPRQQRPRLPCGGCARAAPRCPGRGAREGVDDASLNKPAAAEAVIRFRDDLADRAALPLQVLARDAVQPQGGRGSPVGPVRDRSDQRATTLTVCEHVADVDRAAASPKA